MARADASAFPQHVINPTQQSYAAASNAGMTMREWLTGQALQGITANHIQSQAAFEVGQERGSDTCSITAQMAVAYADAVLAELAKK